MTDDDPRVPHESDHDDEPRLDVDAEFAKIVEAYGDPSTDLTPPASPEGLAERFRSYGWADAPTPPEETPTEDPLNSAATWHDEGHFVPPEPPPVGTPEPPRLLAWCGLLGAPLAMVVFTVFGVHAPGWVLFLLAAGFLGGMGYLVATMRRDGDSGDDGAVL